MLHSKRIRILEEALRFYADPENWRSGSHGFELQYDPKLIPAYVDRGDIARSALKD